jgi:hypothetical protein
MSIVRVSIDPDTGCVMSAGLPRVCMHCGAPAEAPAMQRGLYEKPTRTPSGLEKEAVTLGAALLFGPMGYAAARGSYQPAVKAFVHVPVCAACRPEAGRGIYVLSVRGNVVELTGVARPFADAMLARRDEEASEFQHQLSRIAAGEPEAADTCEGGFDWSTLKL